MSTLLISVVNLLSLFSSVSPLRGLLNLGILLHENTNRVKTFILAENHPPNETVGVQIYGSIFLYNSQLKITPY